jgi:transcriptional regulator with PAS, ATPase and Fis domain
VNGIVDKKLNGELNKEKNKNNSEKEKEKNPVFSNKMQFWNVQYQLVLEALKANNFDSEKTCLALGISLRALSKTILLYD